MSETCGRKKRGPEEFITQLAELIFAKVYKHHSLPRNIISDQDVLFTSVFWKQLHQLLGMQLWMLSAYHPQMDGSTKQVNRTVTQMLRQCIDDTQTNWVLKLPAVEFAINFARSESTRYSPFFLNSRRLPREWSGTQLLRKSLH